MTAGYQLNGDDGLECLRVHKPSYRKNVVVSILGAVAVVGIGLVYLMLPGGDTLPLVTIAIGASILVLSCAQWIYQVRQLRRTWDQMDPIDLVVTEGGLVATAKGVRSNVEWSRFVRLRESENHFLLYTSADLYNIVPKRGFASQQDVDVFRQLAAQAIGGK